VRKKQTSKKRLNIISKILIFINFLAVISLLLSYISPYFNPINIWIFAFVGLVYPVILIVNIFFIVFWLIFGKKYFLLSLITILIGFNYIGRFYQISGDEDIPHKSNSFKVLSYNVHDLTENNYLKTNKDNNKIFDFLINDSPDIACIQEFHSKGKNYYFPLVFLKEKINSNNYYYQSYFRPGANAIAGMAIFSKFPIVNNGFFEHESSRKFGIFADIVTKSDTIRIYNLHLESIMLSYNDLSYVKGIIENSDKIEKSRSKTKRIFYKFKTAFQKRALQVNIVSEHIKNSPYPVIVCGDFNDTPVSYTYHQISKNLNDAFLETGSGIGRTYANILPAFRIDYILYNDFFDSYNYIIRKIEISDHYPISCYFSKREK